MTFAQHLARWEELHGVTASPVVRGWLRLVHVVARLLPVPPWVLTLASVAVAAGTLAVRPWVAALLVLLSALCDGLDGAVAVLRDQVTEWGGRLDTAADRVSDALFCAALVHAGAPWQLGVAAALAVLLFETFRRRPVVLTVGERPTRVIAVVAGLLGGPTVGVCVLLAAVAAGLAQQELSARR